MGSVDKLNITYETTLQRRECSLRGVGFPCLNALPHTPKRTWLNAPQFQRCPRTADRALNCRYRADVLCRRCRRRTRKDAPIAHGKKSAALCRDCEIGRGSLTCAARYRCYQKQKVVHNARMPGAGWDMAEGR